MNRFLIFLFAFSLAWLTGCKNYSPTKEEVASIPDAGPPKCAYADVEAFNLSLGSYKASKGIKYFVASYPDFMDTAYADKIIDRAWMAWREHIVTPFIARTYDRDRAIRDSFNVIEIRFENMDGRGGLLGQAEYPPAGDGNGGPSTRSVIFDNYDTQGQEEGTAAFDFFTTAVHEFGHTLGLRHCDDDQAVMYWQYSGRQVGLRFDDIAGIREKYNPADFTWKGKRYQYITRERPGKASKNFTYREFYTKCSYASGHYLDSALVVGIQSIRAHYQIPIKIISSYRTHECNTQAGGAKRSQHMQNNAIDWKFMGKYAALITNRYQEDIKNRGVVFQKLFTDGIRGFGTYATSNHLDTRISPNMMVWMGQYYNVWGKSNDRAYLAPDYFGVEDCED